MLSLKLCDTLVLQGFCPAIAAQWMPGAKGFLFHFFGMMTGMFVIRVSTCTVVTNIFKGQSCFRYGVTTPRLRYSLAEAS